ncbi:DUF4349 domain-containing protein [Kineococcus sp. SYSU DK001]|uniref:DUF4349 domain-containing protein n=1 Tax=Kineococcus sp. SYSU DK001 TaxID=3383122 RepID=UPI003D7DD45D
MRSPTPPRPARAARPGGRRLLLAPALALTLLLGAAACSGSGADSSSGSTGGPPQQAQDAGGGSVAAEASGADAAGAQAVVGPDTAGPGRSIVSTATVAVRVRDLPAAVEAVRARAESAGGLVSASSTGGADGAEHAHLTLRVPSAAFEDTLDAVAGLGQQTERTTGSNDVSTEVADVDSRVASAQAVLQTFRDRLPLATTVPDVLAIEGEIARRQADLEALQARQRTLADQVSLATVDVDLVRGAPPAAVRAADQPGFTGGLVAGWHALGEVARVLTLVVGAVLPFAVPLALVGVPVWLVLRRRRSAAGGPPAAGAAAE